MIQDIKVLSHKNLTLHILWQYIKYHPTKWWLLVTTAFYFCLFKLHIWREQRYLTQLWQFLKQSDWSEADWATHIKPLKLKHSTQFMLPETVIAPLPNFLLQILLDGQVQQFYGIDIDVKGLSSEPYMPLVTPLTDASRILVTPSFQRSFIQRVKKQFKAPIQIYHAGKIYPTYSNFWWHTFALNVRDGLILIYLATFATFVITTIAGAQYNFQMVTAILFHPRSLLANMFPVFITMIFCYLLFRSLTVASLLGALPYLIIGLVNLFMLKYRNFPFKYSDIALAGEAQNMGTRYSYMPPYEVILLIVAFVLFSVLIGLLVKRTALSPWLRTAGLVLSVLLFIVAFNKFYQDNERYTAASDVKYGNIWNGTNRYMTAGPIYSFLHSIGEDQIKEPKGYAKQKAEKTLAQYTYKAIPAKKKINILTIQLEAYADFDRYNQIDIDPSVYAPLREIQAQSLTGDLTTTIFGGGTVDTERKLLTGYSTLPPLTHNQNSFVHYFKEQNYATLALHPGYGWFYNRQNTKKYLGFDKFYYKENYYNKNVSNEPVMPDKLVFNDLYQQFKQATNNGKFLFNQTVTYQNHGPYKTTYTGTPLVKWQDGYNKEDYAIINNYLTGIRKTNEALLNLINKLKGEDAPVILAFYGDHKPWGGANNSTYQMLGIDLDQGSVAGYRNYFDTPYVMWANASAKKLMKTDLSGAGPNISPMYILPEIFRHAGWQGNQYMQLLLDQQAKLPIFGLNDIFWYKQSYTPDVPADLKRRINQFLYVQYYLQTNFKPQSITK